MRTSRVVLGAAAALAVAAAAPPAMALQGPKPGAASPEKLKIPDRPGSIKGLSDAASVNVFSGQVGYSVPLDLPKGPGGFGPQLSLSYSGELGDGVLGIGWAMGQIAIRRTTRYGVPSYTDADELELIGVGAGGRLIPHGDGKTYWVLGQAKTVRVTKVGGRFEVEDGEGTTFILGTSTRARETDGEKKVSGWLVESATNIVGQQIRFSYERDQGQTYLDSIEWSAGTAKYRLDLEHLGRKDVTISYRTGYEVRTARLLRRLVLYQIEGGQTTTVKTFTLTYDESFAASRLRTIQATGTPRDAPSTPAQSLPVLTFDYERAVRGSKVALAGLDGWQLNERGVSLLDVDGDGMSDLVRMELGNHQYRKNKGGKFSEPIVMSGASDIELEAGQLMDLDGDARPELVRIVDDTWRVYKLEKGSWRSLGIWPGSSGVPLHGRDMALADLNGDGRTDVIEGAAGALRVTFNTKTGLAQTVRLPQISAAEAVIEPGNANVRFADFNGDGLADVEYLTDAWIKIFLGRGDGTFVVWQRVYWPWGEAAFDTNDVHLADLDRDGMMDIVRFSAGNVSWYPGLPNGHFAEAAAVRHIDRPENASADVVVAVADVLGQGSQDVVWSSPRGTWALDLAGPTTAGMLKKIDNGLGKTTSFTYKSSAILAVEAENQGEPWDVKLPTIVPVPVRTEIDLGAGALLRVAHFGVRDGFWDGQERRFGGFLGASEQHPAALGPAATLVTRTRFHAGLDDERVLRGVPWTVTRMDGRGRLIDMAKTDWQTRVLSGLPDDPGCRRAIKTRAETTSYEDVPTPLVTRTRYDDFDALGRARKETVEGRLDVTGDERVVERRFVDDDTTWVRERVCEEKVSSPASVVASWSRTFYGSPAGVVADEPCQPPGQGFVRRVAGYLNTTGTWLTQTSTQYNAVGDPVVIYANGVVRTLGYDGAMFPNSETVEPGDGAAALTWTMTWDHVLGVASVLTEPDLGYTTVAYDTLGRPTTISQNGAAAHTRFAYEWDISPSMPHPRTTTWVFDGKLASLAGESFPTGPHWRKSVAVANGAGEALFTSTPTGDGRWLISGWAQRDERGQVATMAEAFYSNAAEPTALPGAPDQPRYQTFVYDALSRLSVQTLANNSTKEMFYRAFHTRVQAADLTDVESEMDGQGRVIKTTRAVGTGEGVTAEYDAAGRITAMVLKDQTTGAETRHSFTYDTLGRLVGAHDPDTGPRLLVYNERNLLVEHHNGVDIIEHKPGIVYFSYDGAGRLKRRGETPTPNALTDYVYNYDDDETAFAATGCNVPGRLASVVEPSRLDGAPPGHVHFCYDAFGRQNAFSRTIVTPVGERTASEETELSPSGLALESTADDGFSVGYKYDGAGRAFCIRALPIESNKCVRLPLGQVGGGTDDYWVADSIDAAGRVVQEHYGNGATQTYGYDRLGLTEATELKGPGGAGLYKIGVTRNGYGAPTIVEDLDNGAGLNHSATYGYDGAGRLTHATLGATSDLNGGQYAFTFGYDSLQNMTFRKVTQQSTMEPVTKDIGVLTGVYKYAERGYGPRQLTSVMPGTL